MQYLAIGAVWIVYGLGVYVVQKYATGVERNKIIYKVVICGGLVVLLMQTAMLAD